MPNFYYFVHELTFMNLLIYTWVHFSLFNILNRLFYIGRNYSYGIHQKLHALILQILIVIADVWIFKYDAGVTELRCDEVLNHLKTHCQHQTYIQTMVYGEATVPKTRSKWKDYLSAALLLLECFLFYNKQEWKEYIVLKRGPALSL